MRSLRTELFALGICCIALGACAPKGVEPAETVVLNARIYTADSANPSATALVVKGTSLVYVGSDDGVLHFACT